MPGLFTEQLNKQNMKLKFLPKKFTLKNDWKDGGDYDKSMNLILVGIFAGILLSILFAKVFAHGVGVRELLGFVILTAWCGWVAGFIKFDIVETQKSLWNVVIGAGVALAGLLLIFL
jgi:hypothetical protein